MRRKARTAMVGKSGKRFAHVTGCVAVVAAALGVIGPVEAQTPTERGWFSVNAVQQLNTGMFTDRVEFVQDFEEGYVESNYTIGATRADQPRSALGLSDACPSQWACVR